MGDVRVDCRIGMLHLRLLQVEMTGDRNQLRRMRVNRMDLSQQIFHYP